MRSAHLISILLAATPALARADKTLPVAEKKNAPAPGPDWSGQVLKATGMGAPNLKAASPAAARLGAEKAAQLDALRNILAQVKGLKVTATQSVGDRMGNSPDISAAVDGTVRGFVVKDKRYFDDGAVEVDVEVPLASVLVGLGDAGGTKAASLPVQGAATHTGLVVDASGLKVAPALEPRVLDEAGAEVYGVAEVSADWAKKQGVAGYLATLQAAQGNARVGDKPRVIKAIKASGSDVIISQADADALRSPQGNVGYLAEGRVIIVTGDNSKGMP
jgi:hypothetical protein